MIMHSGSGGVGSEFDEEQEKLGNNTSLIFLFILTKFEDKI